MRVFVSGATGLVGRALVLRLQRDGHQVCAWVRDGARARDLLGAEVTLLPLDAAPEALVAALAAADGVVNLAGASVAGGRWSARRKRLLATSRVGLTERLVAALAEARRGGGRARVLVSASAVGYYGDRGDEPLTEDSPAGAGFLADLCRAWEAAAEGARGSTSPSASGEPAAAPGARVVCLRIGVVLGRDGGALATLTPPFRAGLGARLGSGRQYLPWIHLHDLVAVIARALADERLDGAVNAVAPEAITNRDFTRALARALGRPAPLLVPGALLRLGLGEAATVLLGSQRVRPARLEALGFTWGWGRLDEALADLVGDGEVAIARLRAPPADVAGDGYLAARRPRYLLRAATWLAAPPPAVFAFFARAENLGPLTPARLDLHLEHAPATLGMGARIEHRLRLGPLRLRWRSRIADWQPGGGFVDAQEAGPHRAWWHEHHFRADGAGTLMEDRVYYAPPLGALGRLLHALVLAPLLRRAFAYRRDAARLRFGGAARPPE